MGLVVAAAAVAAAVSAPSAHAKAAYVKKAQEAGHKDLVANCQSCHKAKLPTAKAWDLNDNLGAFLDKKMKETKAKEMDLKWLKDYKPPAK
jgi:hypothetical protein